MTLLLEIVIVSLKDGPIPHLWLGISPPQRWMRGDPPEGGAPRCIVSVGGYHSSYQPLMTLVPPVITYIPIPLAEVLMSSSKDKTSDHHEYLILFGSSGILYSEVFVVLDQERSDWSRQ